MNPKSIGGWISITTAGTKTPHIIRIIVKSRGFTEPITPGLISLFIHHHKDSHLIPRIKPTGTVGHRHVFTIEMEGRTASVKSVG